MARMILTWGPAAFPDRYIRSRMFCGNSALKLFWCQGGFDQDHESFFETSFGNLCKSFLRMAGMLFCARQVEERHGEIAKPVRWGN